MTLPRIADLLSQPPTGSVFEDRAQLDRYLETRGYRNIEPVQAPWSPYLVKAQDSSGSSWYIKLIGTEAHYKHYEYRTLQAQYASGYVPPVRALTDDGLLFAIADAGDCTYATYAEQQWDDLLWPLIGRLTHALHSVEPPSQTLSFADVIDARYTPPLPRNAHGNARYAAPIHAAIRAYTGPVVLLHGDLHLDNLLVHGDTITAIDPYGCQALPDLILRLWQLVFLIPGMYSVYCWKPTTARTLISLLNSCWPGACL
jgi:hypothetical protein